MDSTRGEERSRALACVVKQKKAQLRGWLAGFFLEAPSLGWLVPEMNSLESFQEHDGQMRTVN
jgi:hypothetical protein